MSDEETIPLKHLAAAVEEVRTEDLDRVFDDQAEAGVVVMRRRLDQLEADWLRRVADIEERKTFEARG